MNVLSLFDGMSCGQIALDRLGAGVENYWASEIDKPAISVTKENFPNTIHLGDIKNWKDWDIDWASIDIILAGSPCQGFSFAGKQLAFDDPRSKLFFVFVDILKNVQEFNPKVKFLLENVRMKKEFQSIITDILGVQPVFLNSGLVSAQNRPRVYWANWDFPMPKDRGLNTIDILENDPREASFLVDTFTEKLKTNPKKSKLSELIESFNPRVYVYGKPRLLSEISKDTPSGRSRQTDRVYCMTSKSPCLLANRASGMKMGVEDDIIGWRSLSPTECERLQTVPDGYTANVDTPNRYKMLGNGWTVDMVAHILKPVVLQQLLGEFY